MNRFLFSFVAFCVLVNLSSCRLNVLKGEGNKTTLTPVAEPFNAVEVDLSLKAVINMQAGATPSVQISGYENLLKHIKTKVENNTLRIYSDLDATWTIQSDDVVAQITIPALKSLTLSGAPDADIHGPLSGSDFKLDISGASDVKIDSVNVDVFLTRLSGSGDISIKGGTSKNAVFEINGSGGVNAMPLQADEVTATINGSGDIEVHAVQKLNASINGSGSVKYKGHPSVSQNVSGSGEVSGVN